jgi:NADH-quinone oxidoreductase subunit D
VPPAERAQLDLDSGKYLVMWQGPNHPGITGNMSLRLVIEGDTVVDCETHVGYLHRGFEKLMERRLWMQNFPAGMPHCGARAGLQRVLLRCRA